MWNDVVSIDASHGAPDFSRYKKSVARVPTAGARAESKGLPGMEVIELSNVQGMCAIIDEGRRLAFCSETSPACSELEYPSRILPGSLAGPSVRRRPRSIQAAVA